MNTVRPLLSLSPGGAVKRLCTPDILPIIPPPAARLSAGDIVSTLDWELQEAAENLAAGHAWRFRENGLTNAAIVVLDNRNAAIRVMVGSKDWQMDEQGYVNGAISPRQPGSTLKLFAYALAFDRGWNPASLLADIETEYLSNDRTLYNTAELFA
jgi:penicillin-binding protein 1C